jgi:hypothetical protein
MKAYHLDILLSWLLYSPVAISETLSIQQDPAFPFQRNCVRDCFECGFSCCIGTFSCIASNLTCDYARPKDECVCRHDLQSVAISYLSDCVISKCENSLDVSSAITIYSAYCTNALPDLGWPNNSSNGTTMTSTTSPSTARPGDSKSSTPTITIPARLTTTLITPTRTSSAVATRNYVLNMQIGCFYSLVSWHIFLTPTVMLISEMS